jgi:negative regulator of sigma E activity
MLARLWTDGLETGGGTHPHLEGCPACRARFDAFSRWVDGVAGTMRDEADDILTPERLSAQQAQIARRLEAIDRPARVLAFPRAARAVISGHSNVRRWVTVAAAACLVAGFGLGQVFPLHEAFRQRQAPLTQPETQRRANDIAPVPSSTNDSEELLSDAYTRSHVQTLSALDDMTPHARDIVLNRRNKQYK